MPVNYVKPRKCTRCGGKFLGAAKSLDTYRETRNWCDNCMTEYKGLKIRDCNLNYHPKCSGKFFMLKLDQTSCQFCLGMNAEILQNKEEWGLLA